MGDSAMASALPGARTLRIVLWAAAVGVCLLVARSSVVAALALLTAGALAAALLTPGPRWAAAAALAAAAPAVAPEDIAVWLLPLGAVVVVILPSRREVHAAGSVEALHAHLDRARRRDEPVHVLFAAGLGEGEFLSPRDAARVLRSSDSLWLDGRGSAQRLIAVLDDRNLSREGVGRRLAEKSKAPLTIGWATFPADGHGLDRLVESAMADAHDGSRTA